MFLDEATQRIYIYAHPLAFCGSLSVGSVREFFVLERSVREFFVLERSVREFFVLERSVREFFVLERSVGEFFILGDL